MADFFATSRIVMVSPSILKKIRRSVLVLRR